MLTQHQYDGEWLAERGGFAREAFRLTERLARWVDNFTSPEEGVEVPGAPFSFLSLYTFPFPSLSILSLFSDSHNQGIPHGAVGRDGECGVLSPAHDGCQGAGPGCEGERPQPHPIQVRVERK